MARCTLNLAGVAHGKFLSRAGGASILNFVHFFSFLFPSLALFSSSIHLHKGFEFARPCRSTFNARSCSADQRAWVHERSSKQPGLGPENCGNAKQLKKKDTKKRSMFVRAPLSSFTSILFPVPHPPFLADALGAILSAFATCPVGISRWYWSVSTT